jgi:hypothetical protein
MNVAGAHGLTQKGVSYMASIQKGPMRTSEEPKVAANVCNRQSCWTVGPMIHRPQAPSNYVGTRITICAVLGLIVMGFFIAYDAMVHRGTPSLPVSQASYQERAYPVERGTEEVKVPDMKSAGVAFASADVSPPAEFQSAQNAPGNFATKEPVGPKKVRKLRTSRPVQEAHQRRLPARIATVRVPKEGRAAYAQSFFGFSPFGGF